jgi:hypothetical protein
MCRSSHHYHRYEDRRLPARQSVTDPVTVPNDTRVSDADRNRVIELLKQHTADGRLTLEEFEARVDETLTARTGGELRVVLRELPVPVRGPAPRRSPRPNAIPMVPLITAAVLIWLAVGHMMLWLPFVAALFWFRSGGRRHHRAGWSDDRPDDTKTHATSSS